MANNKIHGSAINAYIKILKTYTKNIIQID